jgi:DNA-binding transcriptional ArsR family regulator
MHTLAPHEAAYHAIAAPTRRAILDLLRVEERTVGELVAAFDLTQPAISQHLRVLREAGLVTPRQAGRQRVYQLNAAPLRAVYDWIGHYERFWRDKLGALGAYLDDEGAPETPAEERRT